MTGPFVAIAASVVVGIAAANLFSIMPEWAWVLSAIFLAAGVALYCRGARARWCMTAALAAIMCASAAWTTCSDARRRSCCVRALLADTPRLVRVRGYVSSLPEVRGLPQRGNEERRECTLFQLSLGEALVKGRWAPAPGLMRVTVAGKAPEIEYGRRVTATLRARSTGGASGRVLSNFRRRMERCGISGTAWAPSPDALEINTGAGGWPGLRLIQRLRESLLGAVYKGLDPRRAAIVSSLVLGNRAGLQRDQEAAFKKTGTMHFLAVSGWHVGLVAMFVWYAALVCGARHRAAAVLVLLVVLMYAAVAGFRPSVVRAGVMAAVICGAYIFGRRPHLPSSLALALTIILVGRPGMLFDVGLQLSFVAVCGIVAFARPLHRLLFRAPDALDRLEAVGQRGWRWHPAVYAVQRVLAISVAAWLVTLPLRMRYFNTVSPLAPPANLVLVPAVWLALVAGFPGAAAAALVGVWARPLLFLSGLGAWAAEWFVRLLARVPHVALYVPPPGWWWVWLCYGVMAAAILRSRLRLTRLRITMLMLALGLAYLGFVWRVAPPERVRVTAVPVSEGNCMLVQFRDGKNLLFDAGSMGYPSVGEKVIAPALWRRGVRRLDAVILSHHDADHYNGFLDVAERIPVGKLLLPVYFDRSETAPLLVKSWAEMGPAVGRVAGGDRVTGFGDAKVRVLWPVRSLPFARGMTDNELCCVMQIACSDGTIMLTGDIEKRGAAMLLRRVRGLRADVFQVPHHGRPNPEGVRLAKAVRPRVGLVPCGAGKGTVEERLLPYEDAVEHLLSTHEGATIDVELGHDGMIHVRHAEKSFAVEPRRDETEE